MLRLIGAVAVAAIGLLFGAAAQADVVLTATGEGWCSSLGSCNNTNLHTIANTFAGREASGLAPGYIEYRDWFAFALPVGQTVTSATISIFDSNINNVASPSDLYTLHAASGISFNALVTGGGLGSVPLTVADNFQSDPCPPCGHFVDITLDPTAIALLNAGLGSTFLFGGAVTSTATNAFIFGGTSGIPIAQLDLVTEVPEPGTLGLLAVGLVGAGIGARRRRGAAARTLAA